MTDTTPRFALPLLAAGQAQKEQAHNEALVALEVLAQPVVRTLGDNAPPAAPAPGESWIVGAAPGGGWAGQAGALATWTEGGWRFLPAVDGMAVWVLAQGVAARRIEGAWRVGTVAAQRVTVGGVQVVGARQPGVAAPAGGATVDAQARAAIGQILAALAAHGLVAG